jgi:hypothetical protein
MEKRYLYLEILAILAYIFSNTTNRFMHSVYSMTNNQNIIGLKAVGDDRNDDKIIREGSLFKFFQFM